MHTSKLFRWAAIGCLGLGFWTAAGADKAQAADHGDAPLMASDVGADMADTYFFMGDNRDNSGDSRSNRDLGLVHKRFLIGKAEIVLFSLNIQAHPEDLYFWAYWNPFRWGRFVKIL